MLALALAHLGAGKALAQDERSDRFHIYAGYQRIHVEGFASTIGKLPIGDVDIGSLNVEVEFDLNDKWTLSAGLPWIRKRYRGGGAHQPLALVPPRTDSKFIDDGSYHADFQDVHLGARYLAYASPTLSVAPFAHLNVPSHDYTFFGHAAVGQNLEKLDVGAAVGYRLPFSSFFFNWSISRVFVEETLGVSIDHWRFDTEIGYFLTPRLALKTYILLKQGDGLEFPDDFPPPRNDEKWYQHDRLVRHNYVNVGLGVDWSLARGDVLSLSALRMAHADQVHVVEYAVTLGISRSF